MAETTDRDATSRPKRRQDDSEDRSLLIKIEFEDEFKHKKDTAKDPKSRRKDDIKQTKRPSKKPIKKKLLVGDPRTWCKPKSSGASIVLKKTMEIDLHLQNLVTVMRCSNATPLRLHGKCYTCCFCPEQYKKSALLKEHTIEKHTDTKVIPIVGRSLRELIIRMDITGLKCNLCNTEIDDLEKLITHLKEEHSQRIHTLTKTYMIPFKFDSEEVTCVICRLEFHNFKMLVQHMHVHYTNYVCDTCGAGFINQRSRQFHASRHANGAYKCEVCQRVFDNKVKLREHAKSVHRGFNKRNKCDFCEERFVGYTGKHAHMVKVHGAPEIQVKCSACERTFKNYKYLSIHKRTFHMMEKRHECTECDKSFFSSHELKIHMITHTGQRDFQCLICRKSYGRKSTLREHMRIHEDDRRFKCEHCGIAFVQKCSWRGHMRSKHGEEV